MLENLSGQDIKTQFKQNKTLRMMTFGIGAVVILVLGYFLYKQFIWLPENEKSKDAYYAGLNYASKDSTDAAIAEMKRVVNKYDGMDGGELAQYTLGRQYMDKREFKKAISELEGVNVDDMFISVYVIGLQGDCYSELGKYDEAMDLYEEAASKNENEKTSPEYLFKAALCAAEVNNNEKALELFQKIKDNYLTFSNMKTIDKYIARYSNMQKK